MNKTILGMTLLLAAASSHATLSSETFLLGTSVTGTSPAGSPPWITAVLSETSTPGTLNLTLDAPGLLPGEFMSGFYMNYSPVSAGSSSLSGLTFNVVSSSGVTMNAVIPYLHAVNNGAPILSSQTVGKFDIGLNFHVGIPVANRFQQGDSITIAIGNAQLGDFNFFSHNNSGDTTHMVGADVVAIDPVRQVLSNGRIVADGYIPSGIVPVPEASTWLAGVGALGCVLVGTGARSRKLAASQVK